MTGTKIEVSLVTSDVNTHISGPHNLDADWLFFNHRMTPADFSNAMAIRLGTLPPHLRAHPCTCDCGEVITNDADQIEHVFKCDKFTMHGHTARHNAVRDAIASLASSYGISAIREPKNFIYPTNLKRPDILFLTSTIGIATDVSIVSPTLNAGDQLKRRETEKVKEHSLAVQQAQCVFTPCVFEVYGLMGKSVHELIQQLSLTLPPVLQQSFRQEFRHTVSTTLATARSRALVASKWKSSDLSTIFA
jgi:hypothetical protein